MSVKLYRPLLVLAGLLAILTFVSSTHAPIAHAANIVVNTTLDESNDGDGLCSLREAIWNSSGGNQFTDCTPGTGSDTINFSVTGTITLNSVLPLLTTNVTIDGTGQTIALDGAGKHAIVVVYAPSKTVTLTALTLQNAGCDNNNYDSYGAIDSLTPLNINSVSFLNNNTSACGKPGAALNLHGDTVNIQNSQFIGNNAGSKEGGAIFAENSTVTITGGTFTKNVGGTGGAIYNEGGVLTVKNSTFQRNSSNGDGGAIANRSELDVSGTTFTSNKAGGDGGAIENTSLAEISVTRSIFSKNTANRGGGVANTGDMAVNRSTFVGNTGSVGGGAVYTNGDLVVTNSTLTDNVAGNPYGGAIYVADSSVTIVNSTLVRNLCNCGPEGGAAIWNGGGASSDVELYNTLIANEHAPNYGSDCHTEDGATLTADAHNLSSDSTCANATTVTLGLLNLGPLELNGGPTPTIMPGIGSFAINTGDGEVCAASVGEPYFGAGGIDQRGVPRLQPSRCTVGAVEPNTQTGPGFIVNDTADADDGVCSFYVANTTNCTLREALNAANARGGSDKLTFDIPAGISGCAAANRCVIALDSTLPIISSKVTIDGSANNGVITIDGPDTQVILEVKNRLELKFLTLVNGPVHCCVSLAGIYNWGQGTLNVTNSTFTSDINSYGFGIINYGSATVTNSTFSGSQGYYGGIANEESGNLNITNSTFAYNTSYGVYSSGGSVTLRNTLLANNSDSDCFLVSNAPLTAKGNNFDSDGTCPGTVTQINAPIGVLKDNGGPTWTIKPELGNGARDTGDNFICLASVGAPNYGAGGQDQRGVNRPQSTNCDVGAFEVRVK